MEASRTLIDELLADQQELSAVEIFARARDAQAGHGRLYQDLLPARGPEPGQQYAFEVNLDQCTGCKACVSACHSLNGLDENETWRSVGLLVGDPVDDYRARRGAAAFHQHVTTACHHCVDPGCLKGCPVLAYDKDPVTGIVRHLDDQCIGCQYCVMMCPYDVPQYSKERGIVRKCDMCGSRLATGEAPACAQACPTRAISIVIVEQAKVRGRYRAPGQESVRSSFVMGTSFLPVSPDAAITLPTTRFVTKRLLPENLFAGDHAAVRRSDAHWPLVLLLVLSQLAVGASVAAVFVQPAFWLLLGALTASGIAMIAGSLHLGRPLKAWRSFLGWRQSWFSREVIALGGFTAVLTSYVVLHWFAFTGRWMLALCLCAAVLGLATVTCSAMIYVETRREFWSGARCFSRFFGTTILLGAGAALAMGARAGGRTDTLTVSVLSVVLAAIVKLAIEGRIFSYLVNEETAAQKPLSKTARLLAGELAIFWRGRVLCGVLGGVVLPLAMLPGDSNNTGKFALAALGICIAGEVLERYLFFTAVAPQKMPGGLFS